MSSIRPGTRALIPHAVGLLDSALGIARGTRASARSSALSRERIHQFIRRYAHDPARDAGAVAADCGSSRRTLFRVLSDGGETFTAVLRQVRIEKVQAMLRSAPTVR